MAAWLLGLMSPLLALVAVWGGGLGFVGVFKVVGTWWVSFDSLGGWLGVGFLVIFVGRRIFYLAKTALF